MYSISYRAAKMDATAWTANLENHLAADVLPKPVSQNDEGCRVAKMDATAWMANLENHLAADIFPKPVSQNDEGQHIQE